MDAVEKAAEALFEQHTNCDLSYRESRERVVRAVLAAVGYDALRAERDRYKAALEKVADSDEDDAAMLRHTAWDALRKKGS